MKLYRTTEAPVDGGFREGDLLSFTLTDGEQVKAIAVKQEQDGMLFCLKDCLKKEYPMNKRNTNKGGYEASYLRKALNGEILDRFPAEIRDKLLPFENGDLLRLPTEREIFGENPYGENEPESVERWACMAERHNRIAFQGDNGAWEWYWLQNTVRGSATLFASVVSAGYASSSAAYNSRGVRPAFKISNP